MRVNTSRVLIGVAALVAIATAAPAQTTVEPPGSRRPNALSKPRVPPLPEAQWTDVHRQLITKFVPGGRPDNGFRTLLTLPESVEGVMPYTVYLSEETSLSPRHRELLILRTAWLCGNRPLWSTHAARARQAGMTAAEIRRVAEGPDTSGWDGFEATLLRVADQLYRNASITNATWQALSANYDMFRSMEAVETVNHFTMLSLLYNSLGVQPDEETTDKMPTDVPYRIKVPNREPALAAARVAPNEGTGIAVGRTFGKHPTLQARWSRRQNFVNRVSKLSPRHREMLILRTGWNCRSEYEWAQHVGAVGRARDHGLEPLRIAEGPEAAAWDTFEKTLLRAADELYHDSLVSDRTWNALAERLDTGLLISAVFTASSYRAISMSLNAYGVQLEAGNERFPAVSTR
jgi:4-carboxymuconolactone decarboxylase